MLRTLGIVEACFATAAERAKVTRRLRGKTVLEWAVRRATDCTRLDGVIVLTDDAPANAFLLELVPLDVPVFVAPKRDPVARFLAAVDEYATEAIVRVRGDSPFVDPGLVDRLVATAGQSRCDYVSY